MKFEQTQTGKLLEQVKHAMISHIPVVYIPCQQIELIRQLLYSPQSANSLVPRLRYDSVAKSIREMEPSEFSTAGKFSSLTDNYRFDELPSLKHFDEIQQLYVLFRDFQKEADWKGLADVLMKNFIYLRLDVKTNHNYNNPVAVDNARRSLCIVVSPTFVKIPPQLAPYVRTVNVEPLSDDEIADVILTTLKENSIDSAQVTDRESLYTRMRVSFRGMSALRIRQIMLQLIKCQYIDFDSALEGKVLATIQDAKRESLANSVGLKWEKVAGPDASGLDSVTQWLSDHAILFSDPKRAEQQHVDIPNGILVTGIPGSGKSLMAKTASRRLNMPLISMNMGMILGGLVGESEHNLENALRTVESMAPCILWIDEIEKAMSGAQSNGDSGVGRRIFGTFLTWMQEKSSACFVFATSNDITKLPPELFRSERFDRKFFTFMPSARECAEIFASIIRSQNDKYKSELAEYSKVERKNMPKTLFDEQLTMPETWLTVMNKYCITDPDGCKLTQEKDENGEPTDRYIWENRRKPTNKLLSGADISAIIKEAKFKANRNLTLAKGNEACIYNATQFLELTKDAIVKFKPYGETNISDLAKSFLTLYQNQFEPAAGACILNFEHFDDDKLCYKISADEQIAYGVGVTNKGTATGQYDSILFQTLVGAINHYLPMFEKKGQR